MLIENNKNFFMNKISSKYFNLLTFYYLDNYIKFFIMMYVSKETQRYNYLIFCKHTNFNFKYFPTFLKTIVVTISNYIKSIKSKINLI